MSLTIISKREIKNFIQNLLPAYRVVGPIKKDCHHAFDRITDPAQVCLDYKTTTLPPKKYLLPTKETLFTYRLGNGYGLGAPPDAEPTVIFGVHTCDLHAILLLDQVFSNGHADPNYIKRRRKTFIVSIECLTPCDERSFCKSMGTLTTDEGYDLHLIDLGDSYAIDIGTAKGGDLLNQHAQVQAASPETIARLNRVLSEKWSRFPYRLEFDVSDLPSLLSLSMKSLLWNELGERCLACAACTNVCPTCFCFDVLDEVDLNLEHGERIRIWDSCQLDEFATVAGGHNFRKSRALRQRHRFMRKGKYILEAHEHLGCVGCGRCARACLVDINPVSVFNELYRQQETGSPA